MDRIYTVILLLPDFLRSAVEPGPDWTICFSTCAATWREAIDQAKGGAIRHYEEQGIALEREHLAALSVLDGNHHNQMD